MSKMDILKEQLTAAVMIRVENFVSPEKFDLISDEGKADVLEAAGMLIECTLLQAAGEDVSNARAAIKAALGNWSTAGRIKVAQHGDELIDEVKEGLIEAGEIVFKMLGAGLRGMVMGS